MTTLSQKLEAYTELKARLGEDTACSFVANTFSRAGIELSAEEVKSWGNTSEKMQSSSADLGAAIKECDVLTDVILSGWKPVSVLAAPSVGVVENFWPDDDEDFDCCSEYDEPIDDSELPSMADIYGYEDDEDNDEAALDDILKD